MDFFPSPTKTWHNTSYADIDEARPELSVKGKIVVITGGGSGIGTAVARSFAKAGASNIAILGRHEQTLVATKKSIESEFQNVDVLVCVTDILAKDAVDRTFSQIQSQAGNVDILVNNAGYLPEIGPLKNASIDEWWHGFELNIKGSFIVTQAFLGAAAPNAVLIDVTTGATVLPQFPGYSAYVTSKLGEVKLFDFVQEENPDIHVVHVHPGVVLTDMGKKSREAGTELPIDDISLPAAFIVWAASPEAKFLKGRFVWCNWDVKELKAREKDITEGGMLKMVVSGWPFEEQRG